MQAPLKLALPPRMFVVSSAIGLAVPCSLLHHDTYRSVSLGALQSTQEVHIHHANMNNSLSLSLSLSFFLVGSLGLDLSLSLYHIHIICMHTHYT